MNSVDLFQELLSNRNMSEKLTNEKLTKAELIEVEIELDNAIMALEYNDELSEFTEKLREAQRKLNWYIDDMKGEL